MKGELRVEDGKVFGFVEVPHETTRFLRNDKGQLVYENKLNPKTQKIEPTKKVEWKRTFETRLHFNGDDATKVWEKLLLPTAAVIMAVREREENAAETRTRPKDYRINFADLVAKRERRVSPTKTFGQYLNGMATLARDMGDTEMVAMIAARIEKATADGSIYWPIGPDNKPVKPVEIDGEDTEAEAESEDEE